ncbi:HTH-type transcriptional activator RhaR [Chryseobacterium sp. Bi04]|nr:HTH-type transcriptional activator RhaR [Chryseobacterium sp. Bi04]
MINSEKLTYLLCIKSYISPYFAQKHTSMTKKVLFCLYLLFNVTDAQWNNKSKIDTEIENTKDLFENELKIMELTKNGNQISRDIDYKKRISERSELLLDRYFNMESLNSEKKETSKKSTHLYKELNDSIKNTEKKAVNTPVNYIIGEQGEAYSHNIVKIVIAPSVVIIFLLNSWVLWKHNQKKPGKGDKMIVNHLKNETKTTEFTSIPVKDKDKTPDHNISISEDTTASLLNKLSKFEKSEKFLKKDLTLTNLSNSLHTNPRYLSEIIKQHKGKNFNNYLNGLRIHYITDKLYNTPVFREYKISYLAEACGFSSREVFSVIFKKEMGVTPSYFISQLKKNENDRE